LALQPTATTLTAGGASRISVIDENPQQYAQRADSWAVGAGKTTQFVATGCSISGTTLTIGTVTSGSIAVGTALQTSTGAFMSTYITANISGSGSGSTWTVSQSQTTASGLTVIGTKGAIGYAPTIPTVDILQPINLYGALNTTQQILNANTAYGTTFAPGYKHNGVMATTGAPISSGTTFEMATQYKATSGSATYTPPNSGWGLGKMMFSAYANTDGSGQSQAGQIAAIATENWSSTATGSKLVLSAQKQGVFFSPVDIATLQPEGSTFKSDSYTLKNSANSATYLTLTSTAGFPVKTAAQWRAITGSVGQQVCVSDSASGSNPNGMMAFWDTTNSRWSYIHDNSAV